MSSPSILDSVVPVQNHDTPLLVGAPPPPPPPPPKKEMTKDKDKKKKASPASASPQHPELLPSEPSHSAVTNPADAPPPTPTTTTTTTTTTTASTSTSDQQQLPHHEQPPTQTIKDTLNDEDAASQSEDLPPHPVADLTALSLSDNISILAPASKAAQHTPELGTPLQVWAPMDKVGMLIGSKGCVIKSLQEKSGATITVFNDRVDVAKQLKMITIDGSPESIRSAKEMIEGVLRKPLVERVPITSRSPDYYSPSSRGHVAPSAAPQTFMRPPQQVAMPGVYMPGAGEMGQYPPFVAVNVKQGGQQGHQSPMVPPGYYPTQTFLEKGSAQDPYQQQGPMHYAYPPMPMPMPSGTIPPPNPAGAGASNPAAAGPPLGSAYPQSFMVGRSPMLSSHRPPHDSRLVYIPDHIVGMVIGKKGETIKELQNRSGAQIKISQEKNPEGSQMRAVVLSGTMQSIDLAHVLLNEAVLDCIRRLQNLEHGTSASGGVSGGGGGATDETLSPSMFRPGDQNVYSAAAMEQAQQSQIVMVPVPASPSQKQPTAAATQGLPPMPTNMMPPGSAGMGPGYMFMNPAMLAASVTTVIYIPNDKVGLIIGRGGASIREIQQQSGVRIYVAKENETNPVDNTRPLTLSGPYHLIEYAKSLIYQKVSGSYRIQDLGLGVESKGIPRPGDISKLMASSGSKDEPSSPALGGGGGGAGTGMFPGVTDISMNPYGSALMRDPYAMAGFATMPADASMISSAEYYNPGMMPSVSGGVIRLHPFSGEDPNMTEDPAMEEYLAAAKESYETQGMQAYRTGQPHYIPSQLYYHPGSVLYAANTSGQTTLTPFPASYPAVFIPQAGNTSAFSTGDGSSDVVDDST
eukprot:CAMPEP_0184708276 /NCGR_PEP_ID=MMETSP0313-20130426/37690_1 /TAXON_ID=2792 /ORGANISM="Porphyridium aerugineum, Strain SAG 1380-2" /LENGTH=859 /DNA_ID=CAMNT_0027169861 /DNA_START=663 /DNA_END=3242 /DNA_ORIENTATION=+